MSEKRTYSFTDHLITLPLVLNYRKSLLVSHQHQTSCSEMRTQETMQLRTVCDKRLKVLTTSGILRPKFLPTFTFSNGSEWITLQEMGIELLSEVYELILTD